MADDINIKVSLPEDDGNDPVMDAARRRLEEGYTQPFENEIANLRQTIDNLTDTLGSTRTNNIGQQMADADNSDDPTSLSGRGSFSGQQGGQGKGSGFSGWAGSVVGGFVGGPVGAYLGGMAGNTAGKVTATILQVIKDVNDSINQLITEISSVSGVIQSAQARREVSTVQQNLEIDRNFGTTFASFYEAQTATLLEMRELRSKLLALLAPAAEQFLRLSTFIIEKFNELVDMLIRFARKWNILDEENPNQVNVEDQINEDLFSAALARSLPRSM